MSTTITKKNQEPLEWKLEDLLRESDAFRDRHIGPNAEERQEMLSFLGYSDMDQLIQDVVPQNILRKEKLVLPQPKGEKELLRDLKAIVSKNKIFRSYIGMGYYSAVIPSVIQRNVLENPGWYTAYTPYQAEIAQGRLEALINFQTMITDLTGLDVSNASLLDEGTAAAEAMAMCYHLRADDNGNSFFVSQSVHPQTIEILKTRAQPLGIQIVVGSFKTLSPSRDFFGAIVSCSTEKLPIECANSAFSQYIRA